MPREPPASRLTGMNISAHAAAGTPSRYWGGLYSFKSWYASRLTPVRRALVSANVPPAAITMAGVALRGRAGAALARPRARPVARCGGGARPVGHRPRGAGGGLSGDCGCTAGPDSRGRPWRSTSDGRPRSARDGRARGGECAMSGAAGTAVCMAGVLTLGGIGALTSRNAELIRRWRTWLMSAPVVAGCLWLGAPGAAVLAAGLGAVAAVEYGLLTKLRAADTAGGVAAPAGPPPGPT